MHGQAGGPGPPQYAVGDHGGGVGVVELTEYGLDLLKFQFPAAQLQHGRLYFFAVFGARQVELVGIEVGQVTGHVNHVVVLVQA